MRTAVAFLGLLGLSSAACPYMDGSSDLQERSEATEGHLEQRAFQSDTDFLKQFTVDDSNAYMTSDVGGPISDDHSLKAGERGPTLLEDFIFRQKIQHFDHERVCLQLSATESPLIISRFQNELFTLVVLVRLVSDEFCFF